MRPWYTILVGIFIALSLSACGREKPEAQAPAWIPVRVQTVAGEGALPGTRYTANVTPRAQVDVAFKVNGYILYIRQLRGADGRMRDLQPGDLVSKGTVLACVKDDDYVDQLHKSQANLDKSRAALVKANEDFRRATNLIATQSITEPDYDSARKEYETAQASVAGAKAQLDEAQISLRYTSLAAPMDGVVLTRKIELGSLVGPGTVGFTLADVSAAKVVFSVPDVMLKSVPLGSPLRVTTESIPDKVFAGKVTAVAPSADTKTRAFQIEVTIPNPRGELQDGMVAALEVPAAAAVAAHNQSAKVAIPLSAIVRPKADPLGYAVYVVKDENGKQIARQHPVVLGQVVGNSIAVSSGVERGDRIIVVGATVVKDADVVRISP
ncbi:MAG: efflux RND transporter periplasmic adaptor subunit [Betaproteobacteria bacterium]